MKGPESDWEGMDNKWGAAWEMVHAPTYPLDIHLTNDQGQEVQSSDRLSLQRATAITHFLHKLPLWRNAQELDTAAFMPGLMLCVCLCASCYTAG